MILRFETHATSLDNEAGVASGWFDADLSPIGEEQAKALGRRTLASGFAAVFCSDLLRASRTAELAYAGTGISIVRDRRLRECDYGAFTRRPVSEINRRKYIDVPFPDGESYRQICSRVGDWLSHIVAHTYLPDRVLVIGHRATFYAFEHLLRGVSLEEVVDAPWVWQAGWEYRVTSVSD